MKSQQDFSFIISPPKSIQEFVSFLKKKIRQKLGHSFRDEFFPAHISLYKYTDHKTDSFLYQVSDILLTATPFDISVTGFGIFKHGDKRSIYLKIGHRGVVSEIAKSISGKDINPHITIASNLDLDDFEKAWESISNISYSNYFRCKDVVVLRREHGYWKQYVRLRLGGESFIKSA